MNEDYSGSAPAVQQWPCGPDCIFAHPLADSYGEWLWCEHPAAAGRLGRAGHECSLYVSTGSAHEIPAIVARFAPPN